MLNKKIILLLSSCFFVSGIKAEVVSEDINRAEDIDIVHYENEVETMDHLISVTEQHLNAQKKLRNLIAEFKKQKDRFFKGAQTKKHSFKMVKTASQILHLIHENYLQQLYSPEYLEELTMFSSIAEKNKPVRP